MDNDHLRYYSYFQEHYYMFPDILLEHNVNQHSLCPCLDLENFGYTVPPMVEEMFNGYGYMNLQMESPEKAKLFFEMGVKYYPKSANAYDSLSEYYESVGDFKNALVNIKKAYSLSKSESHKQRLKTIQSKI